MALRAALLALVAPIAAVRIAKRREAPTFSGSPSLVSGEQGKISYLYAFGNPPGASPGFSNAASTDGCFQGLRVAAAKGEAWYLRQTVDPATIVTLPFGFKPSRIKQAKFILPVKDEFDANAIKWAECGEEWQDPQPEFPDPFLHKRFGVYTTYGTQFNFDDLVHTVLRVAINRSSSSNRSEVAGHVHAFGWNYINAAQVDNPISWVSDSLTHLIQDPKTKSCMLVFRGSRSARDWIHNVQLVKTHFCGMTDEDEECGALEGECTVRHKGGSFVHKGFKDHFMTMVGSKEWETNIRPYLSGCSEVISAGHSLGGTVASMFAACAAKGLKPGDFGYEDYENVTWTVGEPRLLPVWKAA